MIESGLQVFKYLDAIVDEINFPKLIVLDLNMPILNGIETLRQLKNNTRYKDIPVIVYTTSVHETEREQCLEMGASDFIKKTVNIVQIISTVKFFCEFGLAS